MGFGAFLATIGMGLFAVFTWFRKSEVGRNRIKLFQAEFDLSQPSLVIFAAGCIKIVLPIILDQVGSDDPTGPIEPVSTVPPATEPPSVLPTAPLVTVAPTEPPVTVLPTAPFVTVAAINPLVPVAATEPVATVPTSISPTLADMSGIWHSSFGGNQGYVRFFKAIPTTKEYEFRQYGHSDPLIGEESFPLVGSGNAQLEGTTLSIDNNNPAQFGSYSGELQVNGPRTVGIVTDTTGDMVPVVLSLLPDYVDTVFVSGESRGPRISVPNGSLVTAHVILNARFPTLGEVFVEIRQDRSGTDGTEEHCPFTEQQWDGEKEFVCAFTAEQPAEGVVRQWFVRVLFKLEGRIDIFVYNPENPDRREAVTQFR